MSLAAAHFSMLSMAVSAVKVTSAGNSKCHTCSTGLGKGCVATGRCVGRGGGGGVDSRRAGDACRRRCADLESPRLSERRFR